MTSYLTAGQVVMYRSQLAADGGTCRCGQCSFARAQLIACGDDIPAEGDHMSEIDPDAPLPQRHAGALDGEDQAALEDEHDNPSGD